MSLAALRPPNAAPTRDAVPAPRRSCAEIGALAADCLRLEIETYPKPGLVSHVDNGSHEDMDAAMLHRSADVLQPYFVSLARAGGEGAPMGRLRAIGIEAEAAMLRATGGVNAHRGAIFGFSLLCAAAAQASAAPLGETVRRRYGEAILAGPIALRSHGQEARRKYGAPGARGEAASGFASVYLIGVPALEMGAALAGGDAEAMRVHASLALIAEVRDTNLLYRGGAEGLAFAQDQARGFLRRGGVGAAGWRADAARIHLAFVARRLSPGGSADLLAFSLFARKIERGGEPG